MALQAFLIGLIVFVGKADYFVGTAMLGRPLVLGALVGLALGDVPTGVMIGFQLELVFMGMQAIGASIPPDMIVGSVLGTAFAITTGNGIDTAVTIAMPAAVLSAFVVNLFYGVITPIMARSAGKQPDGTVVGYPEAHVCNRRTHEPLFCVFRLPEQKIGKRTIICCCGKLLSSFFYFFYSFCIYVQRFPGFVVDASQLQEVLVCLFVFRFIKCKQ